MSEQRDDRELQELVALLERDLPRVEPRAALLDEIRAEAAPAAPAPAAPAPRPRGVPWYRRRLALGGGLAAAAAVVALAFLLGGRPQPAVEAVLEPHGGTAAHGEVKLYEPETGEGRVELVVRGLRPAPRGHHYTVWVLRRGSREMTPVGSFAQAPDTLELPLPGAGDYAAVDISLQRDEAPPAHSGVSVAGATL
jgi:hypothetical protein